MKEIKRRTRVVGIFPNEASSGLSIPKIPYGLNFQVILPE